MKLLFLLLLLSLPLAAVATPAMVSAEVPATPAAAAVVSVPEILALGDNEIVPKSLYSKYSSQSIAETLIRRLHATSETAANESNPAYDYQKTALIQMKFKSDILRAVLRDGFLNQHQTGTSNGYLGGDYRSQVEDSLIHLHLEQPYVTGKNRVNSVRPKYAFLTFPTDSNGQQRGDFVRTYGNIVAVFKDEVKKRSTFTQVDSLNGDSTNMGDVIAHTFFYRSSQALAKIVDPNGTDYWEAQIWGPLHVQSDVAFFLLQCPGDDALTPAQMTLLRASKIPLYECIFVDDHSHFGKGAPVP